MRRVLRALLIVGTAFLAGCPSSPPVAPKAPIDTALRIRIAQAEVKRADGVAELLALAADKDVHTRELALRGLGRSGDAKAYAALEQALADPEPRVVASAAAALGVAASLDDKPLSSAALLAALTTAKEPRTRTAIIEAIGRAGEEAAQDVLVMQPEVEQVALAFGRFGRRKIKLHDASRALLVTLSSHADPRVRYAATYALGREFEPGENQDELKALVERIKDNEAEVRAQAIAALARRKAIAAGRAQIEAALKDGDWRVAVEAARALGDANDKSIGIPPGSPWATCIAAANVATANATTVNAIASCPLNDHLKLPLLADLFEEKRSDAGYRRAALRVLLAHDDPRVRAAGIGALPKTWKDGDEQAQATIVGTVISALAVKNQIVAGTAVDAAEQLYDAMGETHPLKATLDAAIVQRATTESDVELVQSFYALIGKKKIASGAEACRMGLDLPPAPAKAASECLTALGEPGEAKPRAVPPPPVDVATVIGKRVLWHVKTTRGEIVIELRPDVAPWAVATIVSLTQRGYYDKKEFHRVVPNFVVQGGDPTESGWGGPGFTLPAEPGSVLDGPGYVEGGVGMADAGRDTAGSQWFIMHSRAPHLDGRYSWVGSVVSGQKSADGLQIGDRVESATVELSPLSR
jgi:cyclophilin family peptidyl-prolyl cis-trans isomerase/HEAT repeat protein